MEPVIVGCAYGLVHVPDLVCYGSKPRRELAADASARPRLDAALRSYAQAVRYPPNQTFIGNLTPAELADVPRPWYTERASDGVSAKPSGPFGEIVPQALFFALLERANVLTPPLVTLVGAHGDAAHAELLRHPVLSRLAKQTAVTASLEAVSEEVNDGRALPLRDGDRLVGCVRRDARAEGREDDNLDAHTLLEALSAKASGALALQSLLHREGIEPSAIDYIISCGEEATGDRYQRGGGGMAKAIGELCGCANASGMDVKNFCAAPASALVTAGALVKAGLYERVAVVAGGSLAKLGMKFQTMLREDLPILGDCLGCMAVLVSRDDGRSPRLTIGRGAVGLARIGASHSDQSIYKSLILEPLEALGLEIADIDRFAPELHNAELMEYARSGDVAHKNYRMIAATAVLAGQLARKDMDSFIARVGMVGFAPPQGHIPSGVPYLGHALRAMRKGHITRAMFLCKASLFLNRLTQLYDGVSFLVEANRPTTRASDDRR
jgi:betaine reductase